MGRIVHYVSFGTPGGEYGKECRAAIITDVTPFPDEPGGPRVGLCVLNPTGMFFNRAAYHEGETLATAPRSSGRECTGYNHRGGTWHWPERA